MQNQRDQSTHNYGGTLNLSGYLPWSITLGTDLTYSGMSAGYSAGYNTESWLWNAQASYQFLKGKNATIALKVYDILGQRNSIRRTVTGNYIQDVEYNTLNTYGLLTFTYRFNTFGDKRPDMGPGAPAATAIPALPGRSRWTPALLMRLKIQSITKKGESRSPLLFCFYQIHIGIPSIAILSPL